MTVMVDAEVCGKWMPRKKTTCVEPLGHRDCCRSVRSSERLVSYRAANPDAWVNYYSEHKAERAEYRANYYAENKDAELETAVVYRDSIRRAVFDHYGWECACCGSTDDPTLDHVNADGAAHRRELFGSSKGAGYKFHLYLVRNDFPTDYELQTLCGPCNYSKRKGEHCKLNHERRAA